MFCEPLFSIAALVACSTTLLLSFTAAAQKPLSLLAAGDYVTERGWGNLILKSGMSGAMTFSIEAVGGNMHVCSLEGEILEGRAKLEGLDEKTPCTVTLVPTVDGVKVTASEGGACREYCGARAYFEAVYLLPAKACTRTAIAATRRSFKQLYDTRRYAEARAKLEAVVKDCSRTMSPLEDGRIRNDLAVTLHKLGDLPGCMVILEPWAEDAKLTDEAVRESRPPSDAEMYLPIVRATRTNIRLCVGK